MSTSKKVVLLSGPEGFDEAVMRFRLSYVGELRPTVRDAEAQQPDPLASHKHRLRQAFHLQLKELWATNKFLSQHTLDPRRAKASRPIADEGAYWSDEAPQLPMREVIADQY